MGGSTLGIGDWKPSMSPEEFKNRTKAYGLRIVRLFEALPRREVSQLLGRQLLRAGTSVGANYRAACRAKSRADFVSKMGTVEEECDETLYWIDLLVESGQIRQSRVAGLIKEGDELLALVVASINTARSRSQSASPDPQPAMSPPQPATPTPQPAMAPPQSATPNPQSAIRAPQSAIRNPQSA